MKEKSANATVEAIREEPNHSARIEEKQNHSLLMEKEQKNQQWLQKLSTLVLPEADGVLPEDEKRKKIYLWCSKAAGFEKRELYWNTVSTEVNALHRLVVGTNSSDGAIIQLHRIETQLRTEGVPDWNSLLKQMISEVVWIETHK
mgnify:FL=1